MAISKISKKVRFDDELPEFDARRENRRQRSEESKQRRAKRHRDAQQDPLYVSMTMFYEGR